MCRVLWPATYIVLPTYFHIIYAMYLSNAQPNKEIHYKSSADNLAEVLHRIRVYKYCYDCNCTCITRQESKNELHDRWTALITNCRRNCISIQSLSISLKMLICVANNGLDKQNSSYNISGLLSKLKGVRYFGTWKL